MASEEAAEVVKHEMVDLTLCEPLLLLQVSPAYCKGVSRGGECRVYGSFASALINLLTTARFSAGLHKNSEPRSGFRTTLERRANRILTWGSLLGQLEGYFGARPMLNE